MNEFRKRLNSYGGILRAMEDAADEIDRLTAYADKLAMELEKENRPAEPGSTFKMPSEAEVEWARPFGAPKPVDRSARELVSGKPVPPDNSHTAINPASGQQRDYVVLSPEERAKGFVKPVRRSYKHTCGAVTTMGLALSETYARDPGFYAGTFCTGCSAHFPLDQFTWEDGEPMDPDLQAKP